MRMILFFLLSVALAGCATSTVNLQSVQEGNWKARALVRDKEQGRSYIVNLNFNVVRGQKARMDVTNALSTGVASMVTDEKEVRYLLFDSKRFYFGKPQSDVMRPILAVPFDPRWIENILFDLPLNEKGWECREDARKVIQECNEKAAGLKVSWTQRLGARKTITLDHAKGMVQINVQSFKSKVEDRKNLFMLEAPEGYQTLRVR